MEFDSASELKELSALLEHGTSFPVFCKLLLGVFHIDMFDQILDVNNGIVGTFTTDYIHWSGPPLLSKRV
jgi:hypothetical protein